MEHNDPREIEIRKYQSILRSIGTGIIMMGAWSLAKAVSMMLIDSSEMYTAAGEISDVPELAMSQHAAMIFVICVTAAVVLIDILIRIYVGRSAIAIGKGQKRGAAYIVLTCLLILFSMIALLLIIASFRYYGKEGSDVSISAAVIELTSLIMLIEMLVASFRLKKHTLQEERDAA